MLRGRRTLEGRFLVTNFIEAVGAGVLREARASFRVACIGPITEKTARENGLIPDAVANAASTESVAEILVEFSTRS